MKVHDIMTRDVACCTRESSIRDAARLMSDHDCGSLPVVDDLGRRQIVGVVTDRDLAMRAVAQGRGPETPVGQVMSDDPRCCTPEMDVDQVEAMMAEQQLRRIPVVDDEGMCVGMVAQADLARHSSDDDVARVVQEISEPASSTDSMR